MTRTYKFVLILLLGMVGLAGLLHLQLLPPPLARVSADTILNDLEAQESLQEVRQQAAALMSRFVGGEITRHYWGGFTPFMDVLGIELPAEFETKVDVTPEQARLSLRQRQIDERYLAEVRINNNVARGVACRGFGNNAEFRLAGERLLCPEGWFAMIDPSVDGYRNR